jgi:hypothetical protein
MSTNGKKGQPKIWLTLYYDWVYFFKKEKCTLLLNRGDRVVKSKELYE